MFLFNVAKKNEDENIKSFEMMKLLNKLIFRGASVKKVMYCGSWSLLGVYSTTQIKYLLPYLLKFFYGAIIITGGFSLSVCAVSYFIYKKDNDEDVVIIENENDKYINFINNDYERFIDIYKNKTEEYFTNTSKEFIDGLKLQENHETYELPYSYNPKLIFYYDPKNEEFQYYCQSDVSSKVLNSVCRTYTINNKCIQLFNDQEEIEYMRKEAEGVVDISFSNVESREQEDNLKTSASSVSLASCSDEKEESNGFINIFYNKRQKNSKKDNNVVKEQHKTNKYVYKGTMDEYEKAFLKKSTKIKNTNYEDYLKKYSK